jgi:hypothetical protein
MPDLTGIEAAERPELKHLVNRSARSIESALTLTCLASPLHRKGLLLRLHWPGQAEHRATKPMAWLPGR